jgi:DNA-binding transcriptional MerR regulator
MERFTRRETLLLTRSSSSRLTYLERKGIIVPQRAGNGYRPEVSYTWEQILEIRTINKLRRQTSFQTIRKILAFLDEHGIERSLRTKQFMITPDSVSWIRSWLSGAPEIVQIVGKSDKHAGQLLLTALPPWSGWLEDVWDAAKVAKVIDFQRFKQEIESSRS